MTDLVRARRALISVSDKTGVVDLATALAGMGVDLVSTGGTAAACALWRRARGGSCGVAGTAGACRAKTGAAWPLSGAAAL